MVATNILKIIYKQNITKRGFTILPIAFLATKVAMNMAKKTIIMVKRMKIDTV
jgi:hypothetical protein